MTLDYNFGNQEPTRNEEVDVGTSSNVISETRTGGKIPRRNITVRNTSTNEADIITVHLGYSDATSGAGIILRQNESFTDSSETGYSCYQGVITAICETANGKVAIYER